MLNLKIISMDTGQRPPIPQAILRIFGYFLCGASLGLGFLWILVNKQNRGWHDLISSTAVIKVPSENKELMQ